jgi:hypothetical protein
MNRIALAVAISLLAGLAVGSWIMSDGPAREAPPAAPGAPLSAGGADPEARLARLEQIIEEEREARLALEDTLAMLFDELDRLEGSSERQSAQRRAADESAEATRVTRERPPRSEAEWMRDYQERRVARLIEGGFSEDEARRVMELESEAAFRAMQAAWEAERAGESFDRFASRNDPQSLLRAQMGDDAYARYLEAQGQPTAIRVTQVLGGSPGGTAGLQPGDQLVNYNGERVFNVNELRNLTMQGNPGEDVVIEIERDGMRIQLTVPRGPIGITGSGARVRGAGWWGS